MPCDMNMSSQPKVLFTKPSTFKCICIKSSIGSIKLSGIKELKFNSLYLPLTMFHRLNGKKKKKKSEQRQQEMRAAIRPIYFYSHKMNLFTF